MNSTLCFLRVEMIKYASSMYLHETDQTGKESRELIQDIYDLDILGMRHGDTFDTESGLLRGGEKRKDPLTERGKYQVHTAAETICTRIQSYARSNHIEPSIGILGPPMDVERTWESMNITRSVLEENGLKVRFMDEVEEITERINAPEYSGILLSDAIAKKKQTSPEDLFYTEEGEIAFIDGQGENILQLQERSRSAKQKMDELVISYKITSDRLKPLLLLVVSSGTLLKMFIGERFGLGAAVSLNIPVSWKTGGYVWTHLPRSKYSYYDRKEDKRYETNGWYADKLEKEAVLTRYNIVGKGEKKQRQGPENIPDRYYQVQTLAGEYIAERVPTEFLDRYGYLQIWRTNPKLLSQRYSSMYYDWNGFVYLHMPVQDKKHCEIFTEGLPSENYLYLEEPRLLLLHGTYEQLSPVTREITIELFHQARKDIETY